MPHVFLQIPLTGAVLLLLFVSTGSGEPISFEREIRPILSENCFACHGPDANHRQAELRLDIESGLDRVVTPGNSNGSELFRRIATSDPELRMPPTSSHVALVKHQVDLLQQWIDEGAKWEEHWSLSRIVRPTIPTQLSNDGPRRNPVDAFVQERLSTMGHRMAQPEAARSELIRRVTLDLLGLPPDPQEVQEFLADSRPDAYERLVDRLLASPAFGERMAWDWLDAARYADSNGYQDDADRTIWPWRDWVVDAFNRNLPYDTFTEWQIAGDLLPNASLEQTLATAFCRNHMINGEGGRIPEENRVEYVMDMTETVGTVWLGLTFNCCRCHDHKFDSLTQAEYYQLFAFFNQTPVDGSGRDPQTLPVVEVLDSELTSKVASIQATLATQDSDLLARQQQQLQQLREGIPRVMVMADDRVRTTHILQRGQYSLEGDMVTAGVPAHLHDFSASYPLNRLGLARWLTDPANPLTSRVIVNRMWQQMFGVGLVKTAEDFGVQGERPVHQALLDWLAAEFMASHWDTKHVLRLIVTSHTYRQSSRIAARSDFEFDPENRWMSRGPRHRLPAWMLRDQALAISGLLVRDLGGPPVRGYQPAGVWEEATFGTRKYEQDHGAALYRRSLLTFWRRIVAPTMFFDNASRQVCTVRVYRTNTPLHSLLTLNDVTYVEAARELATIVLSVPSVHDRARVNDVFRRICCRPATDLEADILLRGLQRSRESYLQDPVAAQQIVSVGESPQSHDTNAVELASWTNLCLMVFNSDEALSKE